MILQSWSTMDKFISYRVAISKETSKGPLCQAPLAQAPLTPNAWIWCQCHNLKKKLQEILKNVGFRGHSFGIPQMVFKKHAFFHIFFVLLDTWSEIYLYTPLDVIMYGINISFIWYTYAPICTCLLFSIKLFFNFYQYSTKVFHLYSTMMMFLWKPKTTQNISFYFLRSRWRTLGSILETGYRNRQISV